MFCTECGGIVEDSWKHCPSCGNKVALPTAGTGKKVKSERLKPEKALATVSYNHWLAAGRPPIIYNGGEAVRFEFPDENSRANYLRFGQWFLKSIDDYKEWFEAGYPLLDSYLEIGEVTLPGDDEIYSEEETFEALGDESRADWLAAGRPRMYLTESGTLDFVDLVGLFHWNQVKKPIPEDLLYLDSGAKAAKAQKLKSAPLESKSKAREPKEKVVYLTSDDDVKKHANRDSFKIWKRRGRPPVVLVDGEPMYEVQWKFRQAHGISMTGDMVDIWYWAGCPEIKYWDFNSSLELYYDNQQAAIEAALGVMQYRNQGWAGVANAFAGGLAQVGSQLVSNANSNQTRQCMSCGRQIPFSSNGCLFCATS
jgi:hypothetical protein